jgi:hypothetical protein
MRDIPFSRNWKEAFDFVQTFDLNKCNLEKIYDETGNAVYQQSVDAYAGLRIFIDMASFDEGEYTIEFVDSQVQYLLGDFEIR